MSHQIITVSTGSTAAIAASADPVINVVLRTSPPTNTTGNHITLPATPPDGQKVKIAASANVTTPTLATIDGSAIDPHFGQTSIGAGYSGGWSILFDASTNTWYPAT